MATPPQPPGPGSSYGQQPNPYTPPNPYAQPNPYTDQVPAQDNPYAQQAVPPQAPPQLPPFPQQGGYGYPQPGPQPGPQPMAGEWAGEWAGAAAMPVPNGVTCRFCGGYPAVDTTVRAHRAVILIMYFRRLKGPFCKTCGTAAVRDMSAQTLVQGWWGYSSWLITPVTLVINALVFSLDPRA